MSEIIKWCLIFLMIVSGATIASLLYLSIHAHRVKAVAERCKIWSDMISKWYWIFLGIMAVVMVVLSCLVVF